jgi:threonine/homoserine/homoserine lactone efflux protein
LLVASETAFTVVKWCGVVYLAWLGIQTWRAPLLLGVAAPTVAGPAGLPRLARQALLLAAGNPKAVLIFTAVFPQLVDSALPALPQLAVIGATFLATEWAVAALYALVGSRLGLLPSATRWARLPNRMFGGLFLATAGLLATARRA